MEIPTQPKENIEPKESPRHHYAYCCQHGYKQFVLYCPQCKESFCKDCIGESGKGLFCTDCGSSLIPTTQLPTLRRRSVATFLALAFGIVGAHNFYLGKTRSGVVQLILTLIVGAFSSLYSDWPSVSSLILYFYYFIIFIVCCAEASGFKRDTDAYGRPII